MRPEFAQRYESELEFLYSNLGSFEKEHPGLASVLRISGGRSDDPEVRQILDAVALMSARLSLREGQQNLRLVYDLLRAMAPYRLIGVPSFCAARLQATEAVQAEKISKGAIIPFETRMGDSCRFAVAVDRQVSPLEVRSSRFVRAPLEAEVPHFSGNWSTVLELELGMIGGEGDVSEVDADHLELFLHRGQTRNSPLLDAIRTEQVGAAVYDLDGKLLAELSPGALVSEIDDHQFAFDDLIQGENAIPNPLADFLNYPIKESFLRVNGLTDGFAACDGTGVVLRVFFTDVESSCASSFREDDLVTNVIPLLNAFRSYTLPVSYSFERERAKVVPAIVDMDHLDVLLVDQVNLLLPDRMEVLPELGRRSYFQDDSLPFWQEQMRIAEIDRKVAHISFSLAEAPEGAGHGEKTGAGASPDVLTDFRFIARLLCSNGERAVQVPVNAMGVFDPDEDVSGEWFVISEPTASVLPPEMLTESWPFLAQLSSNLSSIFDAEDPLDALKEAIVQCAPYRGPQFANVLRDISVSRTVAQVPIGGRYLLSSGSKIEILMGRNKLPFSDVGFAISLCGFLKQHCSIDKFLEIQFRHEGALEPFYISDLVHGSQLSL